VCEWVRSIFQPPTADQAFSPSLRPHAHTHTLWLRNKVEHTRSSMHLDFACSQYFWDITAVVSAALSLVRHLHWGACSGLDPPVVPCGGVKVARGEHIHFGGGSKSMAPTLISKVVTKPIIKIWFSVLKRPWIKSYHRSHHHRRQWTMPIIPQIEPNWSIVGENWINAKSEVNLKIFE